MVRRGIVIDGIMVVRMGKYGILMYIFWGKIVLVYSIDSINMQMSIPRDIGYCSSVCTYGKGCNLVYGFNLQLQSEVGSEVDISISLFIKEIVHGGL